MKITTASLDEMATFDALPGTLRCDAATIGQYTLTSYLKANGEWRLFITCGRDDALSVSENALLLPMSARLMAIAASQDRPSAMVDEMLRDTVEHDG